MTVVLLGCASAALFGALTVALRFSLRRTPDAEAGSFVMTLTGGLITGAVVLGGAQWDGRVWPFLLAGLLAPGASQIFYVRAVREAGPARTAVLVGIAPLIAVGRALALLDEPLRLPLVLGAVAIVLGGIALGIEPVRPGHFRWIGIGYAFLATVLFATPRRPAAVAGERTDRAGRTAVAATATFVSGTVLIGAYLAATRGSRVLRDVRRAVPAFIGPGCIVGASYASLFEAYYRGRVSIVSPLVATESLWAVLFAVVFLRRTELVGRHLLVGAALIVAGGALIGAYR